MIFSVRKTKDGDGLGYLTFDKVDINIGGGFDGSAGGFKAPITGIYKMTVSGQFSHFENTLPLYTSIAVVTDKSIGFFISDSNTAENTDGNNVSYTWMMELKAGNEVKLFSKRDLYFYNYNFPLTFTGELIHID